MAKHKIVSECREGGKVWKVGDIVDIDTSLPGGMDRLHSFACNGRIEPVKDAPAKPMSTANTKLG